MGPSSGAAAAGIVAGAFGSHGLQKRDGITPEKLHAWQTASSYAVSPANELCMELCEHAEPSRTSARGCVSSWLT